MLYFRSESNNTQFQHTGACNYFVYVSIKSFGWIFVVFFSCFHFGDYEKCLLYFKRGKAIFLWVWHVLLRYACYSRCEMENLFSAFRKKKWETKTKQNKSPLQDGKTRLIATIIIIIVYQCLRHRIVNFQCYCSHFILSFPTRRSAQCEFPQQRDTRTIT